MLTDLIAIAVAAGGAGMIVLAFRQAGSKGWAGSLQMIAAGLILVGASAAGFVSAIAEITFNPFKWLGVVAMGLGTVLFIAGQRLEGRRGLLARRGETEGEASSEKKAKPKQVKDKKQDSALAGADDDLSDIEDILKRHGIE